MTDYRQFSSVALQLNSTQFAFQLLLAELIKKRHGSKIHIYVNTEREIQGFKRDYPSPVWDSITAVDQLDRAIVQTVADEEAVFEAAREYERRTGVMISRHMMGHRQLNQGFSLGGFRSPRRRVFQKASYAQKVHAVVQSLAFWEAEIKDKKLTLMLDVDMNAAVLAPVLGAAFRRLHFARYGNYQFWAPDLHQTNTLVAEAYGRVKDAPQVQLDQPYGGAVAKISALQARYSVSRILRTIPQDLALYFFRRIRGDLAAQGVRFMDIISVPIKSGLAYRRLLKLAATSLDDLANKPFVYFPLHKEPEIALNQAAPEVTSQQALIVSVSRDLPAGVLLVVKEHVVSVGNRPDGFYEQIAALPNVVLLSPHENSIEVVRNADATIAIFGTAGLEAALLGRPVISFARRIPWGILDHVTIIEKDSELQGALAKIIDGKVDLDKAKRDGARFLEALKRSSFDMKGFRVVRTRTRGAEPEHAEIAYRGLVATFDASAAAKMEKVG